MGKVLAYLIPIMILLGILYANYLPFGYSDTKIIDVGSENDTEGIFFLEDNSLLGSREEFDDGSTFRALDGLVYATYNPKVILRDSNIEISISGEDIYMYQQPEIDFEWDFEWDAHKLLKDFDVYKISSEGEREMTKHRPRVSNNCLNFDGRTRLELPRTANRFQESPFVIYAEWIPRKNMDHQQIIGHFNWEIIQNRREIIFRIPNTKQGNAYSVNYEIDDAFYNQKNSLLAIYNTASLEDEKGYIELFVNGFSTGKEYIYDEKINTEYGGEDLSLGWTAHSGGQRPPLEGQICNVRFSYAQLEDKETQHAVFNTKIAQTIRVPIIGEDILKKVELNVSK